MAAGALLAFALAAAGLLLLDRLLPPPLPRAGGATVVLARDGQPLRAFADRHGVWRYPVQLDEVSPLYVQALLGYEDRWFWRHGGVNPLALLRAAAQALRHGGIVSGGSTLTMQVARILDHTPHSVPGKLRQMARALQLELRLSKREILSLYLNHAPFGGTIEGVEAASWAYLGKSSRSLSHAEAALLTVLPQAPSRLRPDRHAEAAQRARDKVLDRLAQLGTWTQHRVADARIENVAARQLARPMHAPLLAQRLHSEDPAAHRIGTTIDADLQRALEERVLQYLSAMPPRTSAAVLVVDNDDMAALAYIGSGDFSDAQRSGHVDMVRAWRSPGSALKPFVYGLALDDGLITSASLLVDAPQSFGGYRPSNFDMGFNGPVTAAQALQLSLNVPAVDMIERVGAARFAARMDHAGMHLRLPAGAGPNLSLILGGSGVRLEDLVGAFSALTRDGNAARVRLRADQSPVERRMMSPGAAWIVRQILADNPRPGFRPGVFEPGNRPQLAWKTGTSYGFRDAWAVGSGGGHTVGVWLGRPDGTAMPGQYGAITALPLMFQVFDHLPRQSAPTSAPAPATVSRTTVCWPLGLAFDAQHPGLCHRKHEAWVLNGVIAPTAPPRDVRHWSTALLNLRVDIRTGQRLSAGCHRGQEHAQQIARWPPLADPWLGDDLRRRSRLPPLAPDCPPDGLDSTAPLHIDGIADNSTLRRPPNSTTPPQLRLRALGAERRVSWLVNQRLVAVSEGREFIEHAFIEPGDYRITALGEDGAWDHLRVRVLP